MGSYLSTPVREKQSGSGRGAFFEYGFSGMQGWRVDMEDAHISESDLGYSMPGVGMFAVFDGHGGAEVANFCAKHMPTKVRSSDERDWALNLRHAFESMDEMLRLPEYLSELPSLKAQKPNHHDEESSSDGASPDHSHDHGEHEHHDGCCSSTASSPEALTSLQNSLSTDFAALRDNGGVISRDQAEMIMNKMILLRRLEAGGPRVSIPSADNVGCTACVSLISKDRVVVANAGDSRAVLCRDGKAIPLSEDHKPNDPIERRRIEAAGAQVHEMSSGARTHYRINGNLNLSRAIGDLEYKKRADLQHHEQAICSTPDVREEALQSKHDEFLIIACDGIWDVLTCQEVCDFVSERLRDGMGVKEVCEALVDRCLAEDPKETQGIGADNMTCVLVKFEW